MVRAGVVSHPSEWEVSGYNEIQGPPERYGVIDMPALRNLCGVPDPELFAEHHRQWVREAIDSGRRQRESCWTEGIAVGSMGFVAETKAMLGIMGSGRRTKEHEADRYVLREEFESYGDDFATKNGRLSLNNSYFWDVL